MLLPVSPSFTRKPKRGYVDGVEELNSIQLAWGGLFTALALAIPLMFRGILQFAIPQVGYSATLASHVPVMLSIIGGPAVAAIVGVGSTLGFLATLGPAVAARASTHILFGVAAAIAVQRGMSLPKALFLIALPLHAIPEGLVVIPFGFPLMAALSINVVGGAIHHVIDAAISLTILRVAQPVIKSLKLPGVVQQEKVKKAKEGKGLS